jgi:Tol biopolymer transport system component
VSRTIWKIPVSGKEPTWLTEGFCPQWSPDGNQILFIRENLTEENETLKSLWTIPASGVAPTKILGDISGIEKPRWSPDGSQILFLTSPEDNLWIIDLKGTEFRKHLPNPISEN